MPQVGWRRKALRDLDRLHAFLVAKNPAAAGRAADRIQHGTHLLAKAPLLGKPMPDGTGRRELLVSFGAGSYVLRYFVHDELVVIVGVFHGRENWKEH